MALRPQHRVEFELGHPVRPVLVALAPLVLDHVALAVDARRAHRVEQIAHAVGLEEEHQLERVGGPVDVVVGTIGVGGAVVVGAGAFEPGVEGPFGHVLRTFEHQVLEQVCEAGAAELLVPRADVVPDVHGDDRHAGVAVQDHVQPVGKRELRIGDAEARGRGLGHERGRADTGGDDESSQREKASAHGASVARGAVGSPQPGPVQGPVGACPHLRPSPQRPLHRVATSGRAPPAPCRSSPAPPGRSRTAPWCARTPSRPRHGSRAESRSRTAAPPSPWPAP